MNFFKSVFSDDPDPSAPSDTQSPSKREHHEEEEQPSFDDRSPNPSPRSSSVTGTWSFEGLIQSLTTKSGSVIQTYRRDLEEFSSGLKKETAVIRDVASRAVKELPASLEVGASVAQESLETVGQAIDDFGSTVWKGTAGILAADQDTDSSSEYSNQQFSERSLSSKRYSRFDAQVRAIQSDTDTYYEEPEDSDDYNKWKLGFVIDDKSGEIESLIEENEIVEVIYKKLVPNTIDHESFWSRYFYKIYKLKQVEEARAKLVNRAISAEEEDLSWDVDDDDEEDDNDAINLVNTESEKKESFNVATDGVNTESEKKESLHVVTEDQNVETVESAEKSSDFEERHKGIVVDSTKDNEEKHSEKIVADGKTENGDSCKDSDISIVSPPSVPEEEELGWDEIEDIGSNDEDKVGVVGSPNRAELRKRLSAAEEEEYLSWDIEDDDEPVKP